jgi:hypothetical protein
MTEASPVRSVQFKEETMTDETMTCYICKAIIELREQFIGPPFEDKLRHMKCHEEDK